MIKMLFTIGLSAELNCSLSHFESELNGSNWLKLTQLSQINTDTEFTHIASFWVTLIHFESFESVWLIRVRLDLTQAVSKWHKRQQICYVRLASMMCTFLAYEKLNRMFLLTLLWLWHYSDICQIFQHPLHRSDSPLQERCLLRVLPAVFDFFQSVFGWMVYIT